MFQKWGAGATPEPLSPAFLPAFPLPDGRGRTRGRCRKRRAPLAGTRDRDGWQGGDRPSARPRGGEAGVKGHLPFFLLPLAAREATRGRRRERLRPG
ncbi:hypothetical protein NDU88_004138 [Pleurodeles waltl]|uniref:Uncharacterized protein n=1 Tax=Pleurodeles waltl TaxID=8319 RepID=A0AAV7LTS7_PLEWA|nr:hypothetical protein NDU88_004138 [Pleurodeles waltl]